MKSFTLHDYDGNPVTYEFNIHPASPEEGLGLTMWFTAHASSGLLEAAARGGLDASVDLSSLRDALLSDGASVARRVLAHTFRNGKKLSDDATFAKAYAGNYPELWEALGKVVAANRFLPLPRTLTDVLGDKLRGALSSGLGGLSQDGESATKDD